MGILYEWSCGRSGHVRTIHIYILIWCFHVTDGKVADESSNDGLMDFKEVRELVTLVIATRLSGYCTRYRSLPSPSKKVAFLLPDLPA